MDKKTTPISDVFVQDKRPNIQPAPTFRRKLSTGMGQPNYPKKISPKAENKA